MRDAVLKRAATLVAVAAVFGALVWSLMPGPLRIDQGGAPSEPELQPTAAQPEPDRAVPPKPEGLRSPLTAEQLTERASHQLANNPAAALRDIAKADELSSSESDAQRELRRALEIQALVRLGKVGLARTLTDRFYRAFPNSEHAAELERLTGYHPRPTTP